MAALLVLALCCNAALAQADPGFSRNQIRIVLREAMTAILERHLEVAAPADLAVWSLRGLGAIDTQITAEVQGGVLRLSLAGRRLAERPIIALTASPGRPGDPVAADPLAELLTQFYAEAWNASPVLRGAGVERLLQAGFEELFNHLDPYSRYITPAEAYQARQRRIGQSGLGLRLAAGRRGTVVVAALIPDSAAARSGLREGDTVLAIDGVPISSRNIVQAAELLEGPTGTEVELAVRRGNQRLTLLIQRNSQQAQTLRADWHEGILWLRVSVFSATTTEMLSDALNNAFAGPTPPRGVVLDLRGNRGGVLTQAMSVSDAFLTHGVIAQSAGRHPEARRVWEAAGNDLARRQPVVVLVDGRTASAAEIVAAALSDRGRAVTVGSATLGKGLIQIVIPLSTGAEILISWSRVLAPQGWPVQGLGIIPAVCTSLGLDALRTSLQQLSQGVAPMAAMLARARQARPPVPASEIAALRSSCPPAEERDWDQDAARFLIDNRHAYESALAR